MAGQFEEEYRHEMFWRIVAVLVTRNLLPSNATGYLRSTLFCLHSNIFVLFARECRLKWMESLVVRKGPRSLYEQVNSPPFSRNKRPPRRSFPTNRASQSLERTGCLQRSHSLVREARNPMDRRVTHRQWAPRRDGAFNKEFLQFNEDTLWSGKPRDGNNRDAKNHLAAICAAVLQQQDYHLADQLCQKMQGLFAESYQPLGNLRLDLTHSAPSKNFRRQLDLDTACVTVSYEVEAAKFKREAFVSAPDQVLVLRVTASKLHQISGVLTP
jgi:hypothetical protein